MPSDGVGADQRRGGGADRPVAAADDQQRVATLRNRLAAHRAIAALDKLDLTIHAGLGQRRRDLVGDFRIRRDRSAAAIEQNGAATQACCAGPMQKAASLLPSRSRK